MDCLSVKKALSEAIKEKDPKGVELLITQVDINSYIENGQAPLHLMANYDLDDENCREIFNLITTQPGIDINLPEGQNTEKPWELQHLTILHIAKKASLVKRLLTIDKINVNALDPEELLTPFFLHLYHAGRPRIYKENLEALEICKLLIENGADVNRCNDGNEDYTAPIHMLAELELRNTKMKEFYDYFTSRPELDVNATDYKGRSLLEYADSRDQLEIFMDLPWKPCFLLDAFDCGDEFIWQKVYQKWDQMDYAEVINDLIIENKVRTSPKHREGIWRYLYKNKDRTSDKVFQTFHTYCQYRPDHCFNKLTLEEYKLFIELHYKYAQVNYLRKELVPFFFLQFNDCDTLRTILKQIDSEELTSFKLERHPFLYLITHFQCDLNETLELLKLDYSYFEQSLFHLQHISRCCTLPKHLFGSFKWHPKNGWYLEKHESRIEEIEKVVFRPEPKSLLEVSRNAARKFLACKYNVTSPKDMDFVLNQIGIPRVIKKFLMLEMPIHPDIPVPQRFLNNWIWTGR